MLDHSAGHSKFLVFLLLNSHQIRYVVSLLLINMLHVFSPEILVRGEVSKTAACHSKYHAHR